VSLGPGPQRVKTSEHYENLSFARSDVNGWPDTATTTMATCQSFPDRVDRRIGNGGKLLATSSSSITLSLSKWKILLNTTNFKTQKDREAHQIGERDQRRISQVAPLVRTNDVARREGTDLAEGDAGEGQ